MGISQISGDIEPGFPYAVYALYDEREPEVIRYIGQTRQRLRRRLLAHISEARRLQKRSYRVDWIRSVIHSGASVCYVALGFAATSDDIDTMERNLIAAVRATPGNRLVNHSDGGPAGAAGATWTLSEETKIRQSKAALSRPPKSLDHREKIAATLKGRTLSSEHRRNISNGLLRFYVNKPTKPRSPEHCANLATALRNSEKARAQIERLAAARRGTTWSESQRINSMAARRLRSRSS